MTLRPEDLKVDTYQAGNVTGVRITHLPTGLLDMCSEHRSELANREQCLRVLMERVEKHLGGCRVSGDRGNELAVLREDLKDAPECFCLRGDLCLAHQALAHAEALLSRLDTLEAGLKRRVSPDWLERAEAAEAQVEALTEALKKARHGFVLCREEMEVSTQEAFVDACVATVDEALSRVSRSEPAPPNEPQGANSANCAEIREALTRLLDRCSNTDPVNDEQVEISGYEYWAARHALARLAPPVPEEQP